MYDDRTKACMTIGKDETVLSRNAKPSLEFLLNKNTDLGQKVTTEHNTLTPLINEMENFPIYTDNLYILWIELSNIWRQRASWN